MSDVKLKMDSWPLPDGEPIPGKTYIADGWVYRDLPRLSYSVFDQFVSIVGEENLVWLTFAKYRNSKRGQILISPTGIERMRSHAAQARK